VLESSAATRGLSPASIAVSSAIEDAKPLLDAFEVLAKLAARPSTQRRCEKNRRGDWSEISHDRSLG
jgi:hypothetical protein